ncbi:MAG: NUDIX domain-containing protein [Microgenomates group bacterium]
MKINKKWHEKNRMPSKAPLSQKIQWHVDHARECGCREIPINIQKLLKERKPKLVVSILAKNGNKYLLVKEKVEGGKEMWLVPGGKVEFGESLEVAAKREMEEEVGIKVNKIKYLTFKEAIFADYNYHTVIFFYIAQTKKKKLSEDIEGKVMEAKWFTKKETKKLHLVPSAEWLFKKIIK